MSKSRLVATAVAVMLCVPVGLSAAGATASGATVAQTSPSGWSTERGGTGNTAATTAGPSPAGIKGLRPVWSRTASADTAPVTTPNGATVFTQCQESGMCAYSVATGALLWYDPTVEGTAAATNTTVYAQSGTSLVAVDATSGNLLWSTALLPDPGGYVTPPEGGPQLAGGWVLVESGFDLEAFNASTGRRVWAYTEQPNDWVSEAATPAVADGSVFIPTVNGLLALNEATGHLRWSTSTGSDVGSVAVEGSALVFATGGYVERYNAQGCGQSACSPIWTSRASADDVAAISDGRIYIGTGGAGSANTLETLSLASGRLIGSTAEPAAPQSPIVANGIVYEGNGGLVRAYAAGCSSSCRALWSRGLGDSLSSIAGQTNGIAATGHSLLVSNAGVLYDLVEGAQRSTTTPGALRLTSATGLPHAIELRWTLPRNGGLPLRYYEIQSGTGTIQPTVDATFTGDELTDLTAGRTYCYRVAAVNADGRGPWSTWRSATVPSKFLEKVTSMTATAGDDAVTVTWKKPDGISPQRYDVEVDGAESSGLVTVAGSATTATVGGLVNGKAYNVTVTDIAGVEGIASDDTPPVTPTASGVAQTPSTVRLSGPSSAYTDQLVTMTATVTHDGKPATGGSISMGSCVVPIENGSARCTTTYGAVGRQSMAATYSGTSTAAKATGTLSVLGRPPKTNVAVHITGTPVVGHTLTARAVVTITPPPLAGHAPLPLLHFIVDGRLVTTANPFATTLTVVPLKRGPVRVEAQVPQGSMAASRSRTVTVNVARDHSTTHLRFGSEPGVGAGRIAAVVHPDLPTVGIAIGTVTFTYRGETIGTTRLDRAGVAVIRLPADVRHADEVVARFRGDDGLLPSVTSPS